MPAQLVFAAPPPNDDIANAEIIMGPVSVLGDTTEASDDPDAQAVGFCGTNYSTPGVWYKVFGTGNQITANTCSPSTDYDTKIHVYTGTPGALECVAGNDDSCGLQSSVTWTTTNQTPYYVLVSGFGGRRGMFELTVSDSGNAPIAGCPATPMQGCSELIGKAGISLKGDGGSSKGDINFGEAYVDPEQLADPSESPYRVCLFADNGLVSEWGAPAGDPSFNFNGQDLQYDNKQNGEGLWSLVIKSGRGNGILKAQVVNGPALPLTDSGDVTAQFVNNNACWGRTWSYGEFESNHSGKFQAQGKGSPVRRMDVE